MKNETFYDSSVIYRDGDGYCTKVSGKFYTNESNNYLTYENENQFSYLSTLGDKCGENDNYKVKYIFNNKKDTEQVKYNNLKNPDKSMRDSCIRTIEIYIDFERSKEHLLIQKFFNDYWIFTGIMFFIIGIYLMILAKNKKATKFTVSIVFGEIFSFTVGCGIFGLNVQYMEWALFSTGLILGGFIGYFCLGGNRLFRAILAITAGFILGVIMFDFIFCHQSYQISELFLTDSILIFITLSIVTIYLVPDYHYFFDSIIGSYIFIRGISILLHKLGKYARFREIQLMLYLLNRYELDYAKYYMKEKWPVYFIYDIFMLIFMGVSMLYYFTKTVGRDDDEEEEKDKSNEENLIGNKKSTATDEGELE